MGRWRKGAADTLTDRQREVYRFIRELISRRGYGPTVREIATRFGIRSPNGVVCHLKALERKGLIRRDANKARAIELTRDRDHGGLPFAGVVPAGFTTHAFELDERFDPSDLFNRHDLFVLRVQGDSMIDAHIVDGDYVICMSGYQGYSLLALPLSATGDISQSDAIVWRMDRATPYIPSPLSYDGMLYFTQSNQAILSCVDGQTGTRIIDRTRLDGLSNIYASPVAAEGRIYFTGRDGTTLVLQRSKQLKVLARNDLDDEFDASPALAGNDLFLRGSGSLYCVSKDSSKRSAPHRQGDH